MLKKTLIFVFFSFSQISFANMPVLGGVSNLQLAEKLHHQVEDITIQEIKLDQEIDQIEAKNLVQLEDTEFVQVNFNHLFHRGELVYGCRI